MKHKKESLLYKIIGILIIPAILFPVLVFFSPKKGNIFSFLTAVVPLITVLVIYFILKRFQKQFSGVLTHADSATMKGDFLQLIEILPTANLSVLQTVYTDVVIKKKTKLKGFAKSFSIYRITGIVNTGIPLEKCKINVVENQNLITVTMPPVEIMDHYITEREMFLEHKNAFCSITSDELEKEVKTAMAKALKRLIDHGLISGTEQRLEAELTRLLYAIGYKGYNINIEASKNYILPENIKLLDSNEN